MAGVLLIVLQVTDQYVSYAVKHYIGVLQYIHPNPQEPFYKKTIYRCGVPEQGPREEPKPCHPAVTACRRQQPKRTR